MSAENKTHQGWLPYILGNLVLLAVLIFAAYKRFYLPFIVYPGLFIAMSAGLLGANFSMLIQSQRRCAEGSLEELIAASSWYTLLVRGCVGLGGAVIIYFFFESGLLEGNLWPDLNDLGFREISGTTAKYVPNQNVCLLVIWCFLAGFSETLVPAVLEKTEKSAS
jgi:hypothetical protein